MYSIQMRTIFALSLLAIFFFTGNARLADATLHDTFKDSTLDLATWTIVENEGVIATSVGRPPGLELAGADHKRINSVASFSIGTVTMSRVKLTGDYQKFGFQVNAAQVGSTIDAGAYFDTLETTFGGTPDSVHAIVLDGSGGQSIDPRTGIPFPLLDVAIPLSWNEWHVLKISWESTSIKFYVDGRLGASYNGSIGGISNKPVGIWNDRAATMSVDWVHADQ